MRYDSALPLVCFRGIRSTSVGLNRAGHPSHVPNVPDLPSSSCEGKFGDGVKGGYNRGHRKLRMGIAHTVTAHTRPLRENCESTGWSWG
jgi:hypothetical protein